MRCVRLDLIEKKLGGFEGWKEFYPTNKFFSLLRNKYVLDWGETDYYDSDIDPEQVVSYEITDAEYARMCDEWRSNPKRLEISCWYEPIGEGIWLWSQAQCEDWGRQFLKWCRRLSISKKQRFWIRHEGDFIYIYFYGRDCAGADYTWIYRRA